MIKMSAALVAIAITAAFSSAPVAAQSKFYAAGSVGRSSIDVDGASINNSAAAAGLTGSTTTTGSNDFGWKLQLGYQMSPSWAFESGYTSLGRAEYTTSNTLYTAKGSKKADLISLDVVGKLPLNRSFSLLGRIGGYRWETKSDLPTTAGMIRVNENGYDFKAGVGAQYDFTPNVAIRGEFERFNGVGKQETAGDSKVNLFTVGAVLKF